MSQILSLTSYRNVGNDFNINIINKLYFNLWCRLDKRIFYITATHITSPFH